MNLLELKANVTATDVALRFLGKPQKKMGNRMWYNSPFRTEEHPSFLVDEKGFHDFGDSWHGDIVSFTERYFGLDFKGAVELLMSEFGITENEYETSRIKKIKKAQRELKQKKEQEIVDWYNDTFNHLCRLKRAWEEVLEKEKPLSNGYALATDTIILIDYWLDVFIEHCNNKQSLYERRDDVACSLI